MKTSKNRYEPVIGIECHVQLKTKSKLFCACDNNARGKEPNTTVCPVCLGLPGTLPVLNEQAVKFALRLGVALNAKSPHQTKFDRKNYFYPDLPKGYQISQYDEPIVGPGFIEFPVKGQLTKVRVTRAHLEEDAGKLIHPPGADYSLVDLNRAGTPLMEIVSEPDIYSAAAAKAYAQELHSIVRYAGISDADMYQGNMRVDVNISIRPVGSKDFGTRTEIKNLNSFRAVERAVEHEVKRQVEVVERGDRVVQETRGWNEDKGVTFSQRSKEEAHDYRYFPEPDLPPIVITKAMLEEAKSSLSMLPNQIRDIMQKHGIDAMISETLISSPALAQRFIEATKTGADPQKIANLLIETNKLESENPDLDISVSDVVQITEMIRAQKLSSTAAKEVLRHKTGEETPAEIAQRLSLIQVSDTGELDKIVQGVIEANPQPVADFKAGKQAALGALVGQVMKASRGQANPQKVNELLLKILSE
jgi:aspartyl-tRNA(Asn)/glutamyl-tRNA(Gln) amidotransferase subunit B